MQRGDLGDALDSGIGAHAPLNMIQDGTCNGLAGNEAAAFVRQNEGHDRQQ